MTPSQFASFYLAHFPGLAALRSDLVGELNKTPFLLTKHPIAKPGHETLIFTEALRDPR
jgi:hypothetical protein